jgi:hypothetical protein
MYVRVKLLFWLGERLSYEAASAAELAAVDGYELFFSIRTRWLQRQAKRTEINQETMPAIGAVTANQDNPIPIQ